MVPPLSAARPRNAAATREAMLAAARRSFARESYDNVGLREIARDAGVDPALVSRYFGSKEALFKEVLQGDDRDMLAGATREGLPAHLADLFFEKETQCGGHDAKVDRLLILLHSASSPKASQIIREAVDEDILQPIASLLEGEDAALRASLCLAVLMGSGILRDTMGLEPLRAADADALRARLVALFAAALAP
jgi:AcrR family transcriptional regulator